MLRKIILVELAFLPWDPFAKPSPGCSKDDLISPANYYKVAADIFFALESFLTDPPRMYV